MAWQKLPKPSTLWEEGEKWFELEDNLAEGKFDFLEYKEEPPPKGIILQRDVSVAMGPETLGTPGDFSRIWVAFTDQETGEIYLARSDAEWNQWEEYIHIIYAPLGSYQPSLTFGQDGWHRLAVTLIPAGEEIPEVWIIEPPYSGDGIRRLDLGEHPRIFQDYWGNTWVFYYKPEIGAIYSKSSKDNFASATELNLSNRGYPPLGVRLPYWEVTPYHDQFRNVLFFGSGKNMPFYVASQIEDIYTVGLDLYVTRWNGSPIEGAIVEVEGQSGVTNKEGLVTFYKLPYNTSVEIKLSHPSIGKGDTQHIFIPESAKGTHVTHALFFTKPKKKENLSVQTVLTGIEWQGTIFEHAHQIEKLSPNINLGIEWESMLIPVYVFVYKMVAQEFTGVLNSPNDIWTSIWNPVNFTVSGTTLTITGPTNSSSIRCIINESVGELTDCTIISKVRTTNSIYNQLSLYLRTQKDSNVNGYYAELYNGASFRIRRYVNGVLTTFPITFYWSADTDYWIKFQAEGNNLRAKVWKDGDVEPGWLIEIVDDTFKSGYAGVGSFTGSGIKTFENISIIGTTYIDVPVPVEYATVKLGGQTSQTNQEGLAPFYDLQGGSLQDYEITHPDYPEVSKGTILIPEGEFDFIPLKIYEKPWDGHALEEVKVHVDLDVNLVAIDIEYQRPKESVSVSVGLTNILWVGLTE